jgi:hypothetical protein
MDKIETIEIIVPTILMNKNTVDQSEIKRDLKHMSIFTIFRKELLCENGDFVIDESDLLAESDTGTVESQSDIDAILSEGTIYKIFIIINTTRRIDICFMISLRNRYYLFRSIEVNVMNNSRIFFK